MKKISNKLFITSLFFLISTCSVLSQIQPQTENTTFNLLRKFILNGESEKMEIKLPISGPISAFTIKISTEIIEGELTIEIYDPQNERHGNYFINSQSSLKPTRVENTTKPYSKNTLTGQISKTIDYPTNGNWKLSIISKVTLGTMEIETNQITNNQIINKNKK